MKKRKDNDNELSDERYIESEPVETEKKATKQAVISDKQVLYQDTENNSFKIVFKGDDLEKALKKDERFKLIKEL